MSKEEKKPKHAKPEAEETAAAEINAGNEMETDNVTDSIETLNGQLAESKEQYLRLAAEFDNFRKRSKKERESVYDDAFSMAVTGFLPILDSLDQAKKNAGDNLDLGIIAISKQFDEVLKRMRVEVIDPVGQPFDPEVCNAVMHTEDETLGENTVAEVLQKGYKLNDKIIRHAMVKVAN